MLTRAVVRRLCDWLVAVEVLLVFKDLFVLLSTDDVDHG